MPLLENLGLQAGGAILGMALGKYNDDRQYNQQERLQGLQIKGSKELTDYQMMKQLQMWKDTNFAAQMAELRKAGLNPGLIYGMGGAGGSTTGGGGQTTTGATAQQGGGGEMGMGIGMAAQAAQIDLIKAQAENIKADTAKKTGVDTAKVGAEIAVLNQEFKNKVAQEAGQQIENSLRRIDEAWKKETQAAGLNEIKFNAIRAMNEADIAGNEAQIGDATIQDQIDRIKAEAIGAGIMNMLMSQQIGESKSRVALNAQQIEGIKSQINLNKEQILNWVRQNQLGWAQMDQAAKDTAIRQMEATYNTTERPWNDAAIGLMRGLIDGIILKRVLGGPVQTPIRGFHNR